jgi:hypothetical protein
MRLLGLLVIFFGSAAFAGILPANAHKYFVNSEQNSILTTVLGSTCNSMRTNVNEPVCNPALFGEDSGNTFGLNVLVGQDYEKIYRNRELISGDDKLSLAKMLLSETRPVHFEAETMLWWRGERLGLSYQPLRATYFSSVRNQAYPDVAVHAMQEQTLLLQAGGFVNQGLRAGLNLKAVKRKFVQEEFNLFDALPSIETHLKTRTQDLVLIEPGLAYEFHGEEIVEHYRPMLTAKISNVGSRNQSFEDVPKEPILDLGLSVNPNTSLGNFEYSIHYRYSHELASQRKFRWGFQYGIDPVNFVLGYDNDQLAVGTVFTIYSVGVGVMYQRNRIENYVGQTDFESTSYLEVRLAF